jgi:hypothetical protein
MNMKNLIYILALTIIMVSCNMQPEEKITWELKEHPEMLIVESIITNEMKQQVIHLTKSNPYFDSNVPGSVSGATVEVNDGSKAVSFIESKDSAGWYFSEQAFAGEPRITYQLRVKLPSAINGLTNYVAQSEFPEGLAIDSITCGVYRMPKFTETGQDSETEKDTTILGIYYFGKEPNKEINYYFTKVFRNGKLLLSNPKEFSYYQIAKDNASFTHATAYLKNVANGDTILFRLYTIDKEYYNYLDALHNIDFAGNSYSLSGPPANAVGNIEGGKALGYFLTAYVSEKEGIVVDKR